MYKRYFKTMLDFVISVFAIILLIPVFIIICLLMFFIVGRPILYKQKRPGKNEKYFNIYKFRTMIDETDKYGNMVPDADRITRFGAILRKLSLDELPQLFNVIKGDLSLIGPRPLLIDYLPLYNDFQRRRHDVKPGITGWAQVNGRNAISWEKKFELDVWYVDNLSFILDFKIVFLTLKKVFKQEGISKEGHATMEAFNGRN
jgi:undecaprenyl phosphate N,N'-diacetylbacillosamine 1-phosphate transferase